MTPDTLREDIARIVDPEAWRVFAYNKQCAADREGWNTMEGIRQAPGFHRAADDAVAASLAKADSILSLPALASRVEGWRTMESAPRDGAWFIALENGVTYPCEWHVTEADEGPAYEGWWDHFSASFENPTRWQPLPDPPPVGDPS